MPVDPLGQEYGFPLISLSHSGCSTNGLRLPCYWVWVRSWCRGVHASGRSVSCLCRNVESLPNFILLIPVWLMNA